MRAIATDVARSVVSVCVLVTTVRLAKTAEQIRDAVRVVDSLRHEDWNRVSDGVHMGATWRIRLNDSCLAAMLYKLVV